MRVVRVIARKLIARTARIWNARKIVARMPTAITARKMVSRQTVMVSKLAAKIFLVARMLLVAMVTQLSVASKTNNCCDE